MFQFIFKFFFICLQFILQFFFTFFLTSVYFFLISYNFFCRRQFWPCSKYCCCMERKNRNFCFEFSIFRFVFVANSSSFDFFIFIIFVIFITSLIFVIFVIFLVIIMVILIFIIFLSCFVFLWILHFTDIFIFIIKIINIS